METRMMRIARNKFNWVKPSGHSWSKQYQNRGNVAFERQYGFGYEEWLFNPRYRCEGYQYGYIRGVENARLRDNFISKLYIYTRALNGDYFFVGLLRNVVKLSDSEKISVRDKFSNHFEDAISELKAVQADFKRLEDTGWVQMNSKFKVEEIDLLEKPILFNMYPFRYHRYISYRVPPQIENEFLVRFKERS